MKRYNISIGAMCPPDRQHLWKQEEQNGYTVTCYGHSVRMEGKRRTRDDLRKLDPLIRQFPDHHITVKGVAEDEETEEEAETL